MHIGPAEAGATAHILRTGQDDRDRWMDRSHFDRLDQRVAPMLDAQSRH
ncbi:MAG: hypothetical protein JWN66_1812 [Sphingomonas bacterium]|nr:hypothetical protein [Sphingomonas bacterium]